jgi:hypothetical protein
LDYLPIEESQKIRQEQKKIFWDLVQKHFEYLVSVFNESDKDRLLKLEIEKWEYIFFPEIRIERKPPLGLDMSKFGGFDLLYEKQFIRKDIDFSLIKYNANPTLTGAILPASVYATAKYLDWLKEKLSEEQVNEKESSIQQAEEKSEKNFPTKLIQNEYAIAYIFDMLASDQFVPTNPTEGGYNKKELIRIGYERYQLDRNKDSFYRAVKYVLTFDLNKKTDLLSISQRWVEVLKALSKHWDTTEQYLILKNLIGE